MIRTNNSQIKMKKEIAKITNMSHVEFDALGKFSDFITSTI